MPVRVPVVVATIRPFASTARTVLVRLRTVEELKVAVELKAAPPVKACAAVHVTEDAAVTKPGFVKV